MKNEARREQAGIVLQKLLPLKPFLDDEDLFEIVVNKPEEVIILTSPIIVNDFG